MGRVAHSLGVARREPTAGVMKAEGVSGVTQGSGLLSKIGAFSEGWVVGSVAWVESFCAANGWLGYQKGRKAQAVATA